MSGRGYGVGWTTNLAAPFNPLTNGLAYPISGYTDVAERAGPHQFYRLEVQLGE